MALKTKDNDFKMKRKVYEKDLRDLQVELCHLQDWVKTTGARIMIVFEGRDAAGKGGTIKAHDRAGQSARLSRRRPAGSLGSRKDADVHPALHRSISRPRVKS